MVLFRFFAIVRVCAKYQLDRFLLHFRLPWYIRIWSTSGLWKLPFFPWLLTTKKSAPAADLRMALEELGPVFIKFGQFLSTRRDLLSADLADELEKLQDKVPPFSSREGQNIIESELGQPCNTLFARFSSEVLASASVAQVYAAQLHSGEEVVVKVVRPNIEKTIAKDLRLLYRCSAFIERWWKQSRSFRLQEIVRDYDYTINNELDMMHEASNCSQLGRNFKDSSLLYVPKVYWSHSSTKVLTLERIYGVAVNRADTLREHGINLKRLAEKGVEIFFTQVFDHSFFHADMHPGNIFVSVDNPQDPRYVGVDFGIMGFLSDEDQYYLAHNLLAFFNQDYNLVAKLHIRSGWVSADTKIHELESAIRTVCEPIFQLPLKDISFGKVVTQLFRTARKFNMEIQPQLILLDKTLFNIEGLGRQLYPELDLWTTAKPFLERWAKRKASPATMLKKMRSESLEMVERLPELPRHAFNALQKIEQLERHQQQHITALSKIQRAINRQARVQLLLIMFLTGTLAFFLV